MRPAVEADIDEIVRMGIAFASALGEEYVEEDIRQTGLNMIEGDMSTILLDDHSMAGAVLAPHFFNYSKTIAAEFFWWVDPGHRGGGAGKRLLNGLESWAKAKGAARLSMMEMAGSSSVGKLYERHGYRPFESTYVKEL